MRTLVGLLRELWGLFVDDGALAAALVAWCAAAALAAPRLALPAAWQAPTLALGCLAILLVDVAVTVHRRR
jgi:hypothetical protein